MKKNILLVLSALLLVVASCKRDQDLFPDAKKTSELTVPKDFKWSTTKDLLLQIKLPQHELFPLISKLTVYDGNPQEQGNLLVSGSISAEHPFEQHIRVPSYLNSLYLLVESGLGVQWPAEIEVQSALVQYSFLTEEKYTSFKAAAMEPDEGPDCSDCDVIASGSNAITISGGKTFCVLDTFTGKVNFSTGGGTLKICGIAELTDELDVKANSKVVVTRGGKLIAHKLKMTGKTNNSIIVYKDSYLEAGESFTAKGEFINHGEMVIKGELTLQDLREKFINTGSLRVLDKLKLSKVEAINNGIIKTDDYLHINSSNFTNYDNGYIECNVHFELNTSNMTNGGKLIVNDGYLGISNKSTLANKNFIHVVDGDLNVNSNPDAITLTNHGQIYVGKELNCRFGSHLQNTCLITIKGKVSFESGKVELKGGYLHSDDQITIKKIQNQDGAIVVLQDASMLSAPAFSFTSGIIEGKGFTNALKATTKFQIKEDAKVAGHIELATDNLVLPPGDDPINYFDFSGGTTIVGLGEEKSFIPTSPCNPEGFGSELIVDSDGDGVPDELDAFPHDPERAYISWYPNENDVSTVAFEDLWPGTGDFDFNDVVVVQKYQIITNAQNKLKEINADYQLIASGASLNNGFAVALDIRPDQIESVKGIGLAGHAVQLDAKGLEAGHTEQSVLMIMDAIHNLYPNESFLNTMPDKPYVETEKLKIQLILSDPQVYYGAAPFNPFIFVDQERGKEIHLRNQKPTKLVDPEYFGQWEDDSDPTMGKYYQTDQNLPWAIEIPSRFEYPVEQADILTVYHKFAYWARSGGREFQDWYLDKPGYRDDSKIYKKPK
ncbi:MAG: LruC domain-containing protein [Bacteroidales bacterium]|jgi:LruC domain-containing protein|nr:LruC domain-containing protein [Bacteroidales bacterium]MDY0370080.1 LruC domain-containing protein [Bacteroidales bacterium]